MSLPDENIPSFFGASARRVALPGCGLGGDVFASVAAGKHRLMQESAGRQVFISSCVTIRRTPAPEHAGSSVPVRSANEVAQEFFVSQLMTREALAARKLLDGRNFSQADCQRFGCGYAPQGWDNLYAIWRQGLHAEGDARCGLARQGQHGVYDYFRGRDLGRFAIRTGRTLWFRRT